MPVKNKAYFAEAERIGRRPVISVKIDRIINNYDTHVKAIASVTLGGNFVVHGVKVVESAKGLFVSMPQTSFTKGENVVYEEVFHPVTAAARTELINKVMEAYKQRLMNKPIMADEIPVGSYSVLKDIDEDDPFVGSGIDSL